MIQNVTEKPVQPETNRVNDFLTREYLPVIRQFPEQEVQASLMRESAVTLVRTQDPSRKPPSAPVSDHLPDELKFLEGPMVDLGFGRLNLPQAEVEAIFLAFCGPGVAVPATSYKLRHSVMSLFTFVEPATGQEISLPANWREVVRSESWIGQRVIPPNFDLSLYRDVGDGYILRKEENGG